jgi:hypothetical protein
VSEPVYYGIYYGMGGERDFRKGEAAHGVWNLRGGGRAKERLGWGIPEFITAFITAWTKKGSQPKL